MVEVKNHINNEENNNHYSLRSCNRAKILSVIKYNKGLCDRAISILTHLPVNIVTARRNELVQMNQVQKGFKAKSTYSKFRVKHWVSTK